MGVKILWVSQFICSYGCHNAYVVMVSQFIRSHRYHNSYVVMGVKMTRFILSSSTATFYGQVSEWHPLLLTILQIKHLVVAAKGMVSEILMQLIMYQIVMCVKMVTLYHCKVSSAIVAYITSYRFSIQTLDVTAGKWYLTCIIQFVKYFI